MLGYLKLNLDLPALELTSDEPLAWEAHNGRIFSKNAFLHDGDIGVCVMGSIFKRLDTNERPDPNSLNALALELYKKLGDQFYKVIDGHFQILVIDNGEVNIFNNRYLALGMYYYFDGEYLIFSDRFKNVNEHLPKAREIDKGVVSTFLSNGWNPTDKTLVKNVKKLLPTFRLRCGDGFELANHWGEEFSFDRRPLENVEAALDRYEELYRDGIENFLSQCPSENLGTLLSGGHDTSFALIEGSQAFGKPMHTFTATFPGWAFDEGSFAQNISSKFNAIHHSVPFMPEDMDYMVSLIVANEEPVVGSSLPVHLCAMEASKHVDNMLAGDGGDTLWGEYFPVAEYHRYVKNLPLWARKGLYELSQGLRKTFDWERFWELEHVAKLFAQDDFYDGFLRRLCTYRHFSDEFQRELLNEDFQRDLFPARSVLELEFTKENFSEMLIESKLFNGFYTYQSFHTHRSMNHFGMDLYLPTINKEVMDFITALPKKWVNGGTTFHRLTNSLSVNRRFHKKALARYLKKEEIYNRSFDVPWYNILRPRKELLVKLKTRLLKRGWYKKEALDRMFEEFMSQPVKDYELLELKHHGYRIFTLLSLEIWCMEYLDGKNTKNVDQKISLEDYLA